LSVLFLNLWEVLQLDGLSLEDRSLHILNHLFLLLSQLLVSQLHSMDLLLHGHDLSLTDRWVQMVLHLFLQLDLSLPKQHLSFGLHDLSKDVSFLLLQVGNVVLKSNRLVFELLQLLLELILDVEVIILQLFLKISVFVEQIVELVHLEIQVLLGDLKHSDLLLMALNLVVKSHLLLLQDGLSGPQLITVFLNVHVVGLSLNQVSLVGDPLLLDCNNLVLKLLGLLKNVVLLSLHRARVLVDSGVFELGPDSVELVNSQLSLIDLVVSLLVVLLELLDFVLLFFQLSNQVIQFLFEQLILLDTVEVINSNS